MVASLDLQTLHTKALPHEGPSALVCLTLHLVLRHHKTGPPFADTASGPPCR